MIVKIAEDFEVDIERGTIRCRGELLPASKVDATQFRHTFVHPKAGEITHELEAVAWFPLENGSVAMLDVTDEGHCEIMLMLDWRPLTEKILCKTCGRAEHCGSGVPLYFDAGAGELYAPADCLGYWESGCYHNKGVQAGAYVDPIGTINTFVKTWARVPVRNRAESIASVQARIDEHEREYGR